MGIQNLIDRHESYKKKGFKLNEQDLFDWVMLLEEMKDKITELKSEHIEEKQRLEVEKGLRKIELKNELDEKGKKKHTESTSDSVINQEFYEKIQFVSSMKLKSELLNNKTDCILEYVNLIKLKLKNG